jgi:hypothetical protein
MKMKMKKYQIPLIEVAHISAMSMLMDSPGADIQGNPSGGPNNPGGFGAPARPF